MLGLVVNLLPSTLPVVDCFPNFCMVWFVFDEPELMAFL